VQQAVQIQDFKALVDSHPRAMLLVAGTGEIVYVNRAFTSVTGYSRNEVMGRAPSLLSSGLHGPDFYQAMWAALEQRGRWEGLIWNRRKSGETYPQWLTIYTVEYGQERLFGGVFLDVGDIAASDERLASLAYYDALTELPNRALFQEFLKARVSRRSQENQCFGVLFVDLDFFKSVNDLHGHECGDQVLQQVARRIQGLVRSGDVLARLSGDEFAAMIELRSEAELERVCERTVSAFQSPFRVGDREYFLSASVGAALYPLHGRSSGELLQNSDRAMYMAKLAGRSCYRVFSAVDTEQGRREQRLAEALITSMKNAPQHFRVVYQPQYDLDTGAVAGLEALLRWHHPEFGAVSPADFVSTAEQRGYIHELTEHLVRCILADLPSADHSLPQGLRLAINISARQIMDPRMDALLEPLGTKVRSLGWTPEIEITETHLMRLSEACLSRLRELGSRGVKVAIDDFGTGYSSLAYLHALPVQVLKVDQQFIGRLQEGGADSRIVSAILGIADALDLEVVAEGIEHRSQFSFLRKLRCHRGQGFLMAKPAPWAEIKSILFDKYQ